MKGNIFVKVFVIFITIGASSMGIVGCDKGIPSPVPAATCMNRHLFLADSICNMGGVRPAYEHHLHMQEDSGKIVSKILTDTSGVYFQVVVGADKSVTYNGIAYSLIDSAHGVMHFVHYFNPTYNQTHIYYYTVNDSFLIAATQASYLPQVTTTDIDTLLGYW
jgi:hypothetical protein